MLQIIDDSDRTQAIWWQAEVIEIVLSNRRAVILSDTVCYYKLATYQKCFCRVQFSKLRGILNFLRNLDGVNDFIDSESVWILADEVEPELDTFFL